MSEPVNDDDHRPDLGHRAGTRKLALGGALQIVRARNVWSVNDAASAAQIAPMTWRRMEDGLDVRQRTHVAVDKLLDLPFGTVKRALNDDALMVQLVTVCGADAREAADDPAAFLEAFAEQTRTGSPRQVREGDLLGRWTQGVPAGKPTNLELATQLVQRLAALPSTTAIDDAVQAILKAMPDLI